MRSAGNFSPEWGYLAPAPSFARTARVVLVATAIGATAGAGVVLSLIDRPTEPEKTAIAARAIVTSVRATAVPSVSPVSAVTTASPAAPGKPAPQPASVAAASSDKPDNSAGASVRPIPQSSPKSVPATGATAATASAGESVALPAEPPQVVDAAPADGPDAIVAPEPVTPPKKAKHHASGKAAPFAGIGSIFRRVFAAHSGRSYYPNSQ
jgi:hypothetical protein